uniref:Uncharacterized protein TCIL3000_3_2240 n=1 Tax=Trypanosoma congolense (strain IL3000) TaxID=1068625 RepID=G0UK87_TRYCI|nr:unnamed protein product [Trypanosoma congolense IL3000]
MSANVPVPGSADNRGASLGFGATPTAGMSGGFGGLGVGMKTGFGVNASSSTFGGISINKGFGVPSAQPQIPPYKGIKGPGFSTDWLQKVNVSSLRDDVLFGDLPPPLQQHLMEIHNFIQAEHEAKQAVEAFLTDSTTRSIAGDAGYRKLVTQLSQLTGGENAVDAIRVDCFEREVQSHKLSRAMDRCEEDIHNYMKQVWTPLSGLDFTLPISGSRPRPSLEPFQRALRETEECMKGLSTTIAELKASVVPGGHCQRGIVVDDKNNINSVADPSSSSAASVHSRLTSGLQPPHVPLALGLGVSAHPIVRIISSLSNELTALLNLAARTLWLHTRADNARDIFVHRYGAPEAELIFAQRQQEESSTDPRRPFALSSTAATSADVKQDTIGDIHRRSACSHHSEALSDVGFRMQYDVLLERSQQNSVPTATTAPATSSAGPVAPATTFGAATAPSPAVPGMGFAQTSSLGTEAGARFGGRSSTTSASKRTLTNGYRS